jgi:hypothetical protein
MSTKTLRKRIALVAVSALTAGLFSVVSTPAANAAVAIEDVVFATKSDLVNSSACTIANTTGYGAKLGRFPSGSLVTLTRAVGTDATYISITGPAIVEGASVAAGTTASATITSTSITDGTAVVGDLYKIRLTGVGTVTVNYASASTATPVDYLTISSVASCSNDLFSATYSEISTTSDGTDATATTANVDDNTSVTAGGTLHIRIDGDDAYNANIATGLWAASATNGALVSISSAIGTAAAKGTVSAVSATDADGAIQVRVDPSQTATTSTTVVTVTHNGNAVTTKSLTFHGEAAKIVVGKVASGRTGTADTGYFLYTYQDSAGNTVPDGAAAFVGASASTRITTGTSVKAPTSSAASTSSANLADAQEALIGSTTTNGIMAYTCGSSSGSQAFTITLAATAVNANTLTATVPGVCAGGIATYTVSTNQASYAVGEVATITIDAKDSSGNAVSDNTVITTGSVSVGGGALTATIAGTEVFTAGKRTLQAQMTTAGKFNIVVALAGSVTTTATTGYTVTDGAVSNAEVLKSIVALIASINKQIQALQKLILRR